MWNQYIRFVLAIVITNFVIWSLWVLTVQYSPNFMAAPARIDMTKFTMSIESEMTEETTTTTTTPFPIQTTWPTTTLPTTIPNIADVPIITFFTTIRPIYSDTPPEIYLLQRAAITSWSQLRPPPNILIGGNNYTETAPFLNIPRTKSLLNLTINLAFDLPTLDSVFRNAYKEVTSDYLVFINSDIFVNQKFMDAIKHVLAVYPPRKIMMSGIRHNVDADFKMLDKWSPSELLDHFRKHGKPFIACGQDYFLLKKGMFSELPPYLCGRPAADNWLIGYSMLHKDEIFGIDASQFIDVYHINHVRTSNPTGASYNRAMGSDIYMKGGNVHDLTHKYRSNGVIV
jgi:hypothetical protein